VAKNLKDTFMKCSGYIIWSLFNSSVK